MTYYIYLYIEVRIEDKVIEKKNIYMNARQLEIKMIIRSGYILKNYYCKKLIVVNCSETSRADGCSCNSNKSNNSRRIYTQELLLYIYKVY